MICPSDNSHFEELDFGLVVYIDNLIRQVQAPEYQERLNQIQTDAEALILIAELEAMRLPLPYERVPQTVKEQGETIRFLADKDDFYERNIDTGIRGGDSFTEGQNS